MPEPPLLSTQKMAEKKLACIILAAGKGKRMHSCVPKVLHKLAGLPAIKWVINNAVLLEPEKVVVVVGDNMPELEKAASPHETAIQKNPKGTGHAVKTAIPNLKGFDGDVLILLGDMPLLLPETLVKLVQEKQKNPETVLAVLGAEAVDPTGYGRLVTSSEGFLKKIVEEKDADPEEKSICLINTGAFCISAEALSRLIDKVENKNAQGEFYATDLVELAASEGGRVTFTLCNDIQEMSGINSRSDLSLCEALLQDRLRRKAMEWGATLLDPTTTYFAHDTKLGRDVLIEPNVVFGPGVDIADNVEIRAFSHIEGVKIEKGCCIGPFARLRPGTHLSKNVRIGNFVEIKNTHMGEGTKANHLSYIGDGTVGRNVNFGAGSIIVNYDGFFKHRTEIGDDVMVGCNANLISPVKIGKGSFLAAGSTIKDDVPDNALAIARSENQIKPGWAEKNRQNKKKAG